MPHSRQASVSSGQSFDLLGPMNSSGPYPSFDSKPGVAISSSTPSSKQANAWKRASMPASDSYTNLLSRSDLENLRSRRAGDRSSMNSFYDNAPRQRTYLYEDSFKFKDSSIGTVRDRVQRDSPVIAELRTNVIIKDEFTLVTDLSYHLAARYSRPDSSIMVKVDHSACLALGGTFDPCYILTITAVPSQMGPTMNKRNAALIQSFMADILSVPPDRGIVKFETIQEENFATNGSTLLGEIERQEKQHSTDNSGIRRNTTNASRKSAAYATNGVLKVEEDARAGREEAYNNLGRAKSTTSAGVSTSNGVFELPGEIDRKRPSTVHSHAGSDGLRMNGVSNNDFGPRRDLTRPERPKSVVQDAQSVQEQLRDLRDEPLPSTVSYQKPQPARTPLASSAQKERPVSYARKEPVVKPVAAGSRVSQGARHSQISAPDSKPKPRDSYLDGFLGSVLTSKDLEPTITENHAAEKMAEKKETVKDLRDTAANTAKRRSNITATPKMPSPPPIPETTSVKSMKVGKRKSFLSAFRRSTAAH